MDIEKCLVIRCQISMQRACRACTAGDWLSRGLQVIHKVMPSDGAHHMNL